jgi:hypothetical protein
MSRSRTRELLVSVLAGFVGAGIFALVFHDVPVQSSDRTVVSAHAFQLLSDKNQIVGLWGSHTNSQLPFMSLEAPFTSGEQAKSDGAILIGFHAGVPMIRVHGADRKGGVVLSTAENSGHLSIVGSGAQKILHLDSDHADTWNALLKSGPK